jgi:ADP-ribose pyrophosphatase YjhB (NUDIX family)
MATIQINTWGVCSVGEIAVRTVNGEPAEDAVRRSIERRTGLKFWSFISDGAEMSSDGRR